MSVTRRCPLLGMSVIRGSTVAPEREKCCIPNSHPYVGNSLGNDYFELFFLSVTSTYLMCFLRGRPRGQSVLAVGRHLLVHVRERCINCKCMSGKRSNFFEKERKQEFIKKISYRNQKDVGMGDDSKATG